MNVRGGDVCDGENPSEYVDIGSFNLWNDLIINFKAIGMLLQIKQEAKKLYMSLRVGICM